jgi:hypothetical protein
VSTIADSTTLIISVIAPAATLLCAIIITFLIGSGWSAVARRHPLHHPVQGEKLAGVSARIGSITYQRCLTITLAPQGFAVNIIFPFSLFQKPFFIDWRQADSLRQVRMLGFKRLELGIRNESLIFYFRGKNETALIAAAASNNIRPTA